MGKRRRRRRRRWEAAAAGRPYLRRLLRRDAKGLVGVLLLHLGLKRDVVKGVVLHTCREREGGSGREAAVASCPAGDRKGDPAMGLFHRLAPAGVRRRRHMQDAALKQRIMAGGARAAARMRENERGTGKAPARAPDFVAIYALRRRRAPAALVRDSCRCMCGRGVGSGAKAALLASAMQQQRRRPAVRRAWMMWCQSSGPKRGPIPTNTILLQRQCPSLNRCGARGGPRTRENPKPFFAAPRRYWLKRSRLHTSR